MKAVAQLVGIFLVVIIVGLGITWAAQGSDFFMYKVFAPKYEQVRRETFEQSKAYNQGMIQELQNMQFEYIQAGDNEKAALASIILHRCADYPPEAMPTDLRLFIEELRAKQSY